MGLPEVRPDLVRMRDINAKLKQACPRAESLCYIDCWISTEPGAAAA